MKLRIIFIEWRSNL